MVRGTGHNNIFTIGEEMFCVYHGRTQGDSRRLFIDRMKIDAEGVLRVHGPTTTPQPSPMTALIGTFEFRGVWVTTVSNGDWPTKQGLSVEQMKRQ